MTLTLTDLFCGAGGSSSGAELVNGVETAMAANHWAKAIATHQHNLPHAAHDCADISQIDPRRYPATDLLWASPECTNHSQAKSIRDADRIPDLFQQTLPDEAAERSRATMWDVARFLEAKLLAGHPLPRLRRRKRRRCRQVAALPGLAARPHRSGLLPAHRLPELDVRPGRRTRCTAVA